MNNNNQQNNQKEIHFGDGVLDEVKVTTNENLTRFSTAIVRKSGRNSIRKEVLQSWRKR